MPSAAQRWLIGGRVQGVGFRPFVWLLANDLGVCGTVRNCGGHVEIVAGADERQASAFLERLLAEHPPIAQPRLLSAEPWAEPAGDAFRILPSTGGPAAVVLPDQPVCAACLAEMADPAARRYRYPFTACTQCGPRYTITRRMPFDRANTGMAGFPFCDPCRREYEAPADRRFHAEVAACPNCGPSLWFRSADYGFEAAEAAMSATVAALRRGAIVAVKGVGGYHLMCDAGDDAAVLRLRAMKRRATKPLAVLVPPGGADDLDGVRVSCFVTAAEARSLRSVERPIVLLTLRPGNILAPSLAPGLPELGVMLPYSPLHHQLADAFGGPLVATSGNAGGEPIVTDPASAERRLGPGADAFLHHDRPIEHAADDGVVRVIGGRGRAIRLGRGSAPMERSLQHPVTPLLALGGQDKVTLALGFGARVVISPHVGDLGNPQCMERFEALIEAFPRLYGVQPASLVCDAHGGYGGTSWARRSGLPVLRVWHHHAHAAAVAGEFTDEPRWLCFTWDGAGLGPDGTLWGGEALLGRPGVWQRAATFRPFLPPGGERAAREPWRSAGGLAWELALDWNPSGIDTTLVKAAWARRLNSPVTTSAGRLFDAAAAFIHIKQHTSHEGEAAMAVEALAGSVAGEAGPVPLPLHVREDGVLQADWAPLVKVLLDATRSQADRAAVFQASMAATLVNQAIAVRKSHGDFAVGLSGGVFQNRRLAESALAGLAAADFRAYLPTSVPCNDAGLSFGQVIEAAACGT
jgi:hydrogenase maturation protein HypF